MITDMVRLNKYCDRGDYYEIILTNRSREETGRAKIDKVDLETVQVCRWSKSTTTGTTQGWVKGGITTMHQLLVGKKEGYVIDHINHDSLDNRRANLRHATKSQNAMNRKKAGGVIYLASRKDLKKKWFVQLWVNNKRVFNKYCLTEEEALVVRRRAELEYFGDFAPQRAT